MHYGRGSIKLFFRQDPRLKGYWPFGHSNPIDESGNSLHGTLQGSAQLGGGRFGRGLVLPGASTDYLSTPNTGIPNSYPFTVMAWVYRKSGGAANQCVCALWNGFGTGTGWSLLINSSGYLLFNNYQSGAGATATATVSPLALERWHFVEAVLANATVRFRVNGATTQTLSLTDRTPAVSQPFTIGNSNADVTAQYLAGTLSEVAVFSRAVSDAESSAYFRWATNQRKRVWFLRPAEAFSSALSETVALVPALSFSTLRSLVETIALVDTAAVVRVVLKSLDETITLAETFTAKITGRALTEVVTLVDRIDRSFVKPLSEAVFISESLATLRVFFRSMSDSLSVRPSLGVFLNGVSVGLWKKLARATGTWSKSPRPSGSWRKVDRPGL